MVIENIKEKIISRLGSISGAASILGSWQVCHNVCLGLIALLSIIGITLTGMPLVFFTKIAIPMWTLAVGILLITYWFYFKKRCISRNLIMLNTGLIIAGTPFQSLQNYSIYFWIIGGGVVMTSIGLFIRGKVHNSKNISYENLLMYLILVALLMILLYGLTGFATHDVTHNNFSTTEPQVIRTPIGEFSFKSITTGTTESGDVAIDLEPHYVKNGKLEVDIIVNTHSVDLDNFDLTKITTMEYDGNVINPTAAPKLSGHHNSGTLMFDVDGDFKNFAIKIKGIPKLEERIYEWRE